MTDRELDARLAEALGYTLKRVGMHQDDETGAEVICPDCDYEQQSDSLASRHTWHDWEDWALVNDRNGLELVPAYSTTWEGMRQVVEAMRGRGWYWKANIGFTDGMPGRDDPYIAGFGRPGNTPADYIATDAESLPRATALAALAALDRPVEGVQYGGWLGAGLPVKQ